MKKFGSAGFEVVGVNVGDSKETLAMVQKKHNLGEPCFFLEQDYSISDAAGVNSFPTYVLIDREGKIVSARTSVDEGEIRRLINADK